MAKKIFLIAGLIDIQKAGNQTFKNTLYYLAKAGFKITVFSFLPVNYPNLLSEKEVLGNLSKQVHFYRLPKFLFIFFKLGRWLKNLFRENKKTKIGGIPNFYSKPETIIEYFADFKKSSQIIYFFSWLFYIFLETPRVLIFTLKEKPDLFYGYETYGAPVASILGKIFGRPIVTRFQGTALDIKKKSQWKYFPHHILGLKSHANAIIMGNDGTRGKEVLTALRVSPNKIYFWMNGLDLNDLVIYPERIKELKEKYNLLDRKILLSVSRLNIWKRVDRMIFVLKELKKKYKITSTLLIIGEGPERKSLEELVKIYKLSDRVIFLGWIPHAGIGTYLSLANVFLITNDVSNLSNQLLEALYSGLPVVSLKDGSTDALLRDGYNALLVPLDKIEEELPRAVYKILTDDDLAEKLSKGAKSTAEEKLLTWEERMEKEIELINKLIPKKS